MANPEHVEILKQGVEVWNRWRTENQRLLPDLRESTFKDVYWVGIDLSNVDLSYSDFRRSELKQSDFEKSKIVGANFSNASLAGCDFFSSNLRNTDFSNASIPNANLMNSDLSEGHFDCSDLSSSKLRNANLERTSFFRTRLYNADLSYSRFKKTNCSEAFFGWTIFAETDFREIHGLDSTKHMGPSSIGIDSIFCSNGEMPSSFLRMVGIPENFIQYVSSFSQKVIDFYTCFISYSNKDHDFAQRFFTDLQNKGVRCWFAPEDMKIGDKIRDRIDQSIKIHDKLLLVLSEHSINSEWVEDEVDAAYEQERTREKTVLFPIRLDEAVMETDKAWASKLRRSRHIGDFRKWKNHDSYQKAFDRLLNDLKAEKPQTD